MKKVFDSVEDRAAGGNLDINTQEIGALSCVMYVQELGGDLTIANRLRAADALTGMYTLAIHGGTGNGKQTVGFNIFADQVRFGFVIAATNFVRIIMFDEPITPFGSWVRARANPNIVNGASNTPFAAAAIGAYRFLSSWCSATEPGRITTTIARSGLSVSYAQATGQLGSGVAIEKQHVFPSGDTFTTQIDNIGAAAVNFPVHVIGHF